MALARQVILACLALHFGISGWTAASVTAAIDATGRSSLVLFSMTFVASSLQRLCPSSHAIHLGLIIAMSLDFPDPFQSEQPAVKWLFGEVDHIVAG